MLGHYRTQNNNAEGKTGSRLWVLNLVSRRLRPHDYISIEIHPISWRAELSKMKSGTWILFGPSGAAVFGQGHVA
jgi:hypothetical protein